MAGGDEEEPMRSVGVPAARHFRLHLLQRVPGEEMISESCDAICKTLDHVAVANLLYPPGISPRSRSSKLSAA